MHGRHRCQVANDPAQGVVDGQLIVTKRNDNQRGQIPDSPSQESEEIQRRLIRPVRIFRQDHRGPRAVSEIRLDGAKDVGSRGVGAELVFNVRTKLTSDIEQRPKWRRNGEPVERNRDQARVALDSSREPINQGRLADAHLAAHENDMSSATRGILGPGKQLIERRRSFEEGHRCT